MRSGRFGEANPALFGASQIWMEAMNLPLSNAKLCMNCEQISDARGETCPACAARANWLPIGRLLGSLAEEEREPEKVKGVAA